MYTRPLTGVQKIQKNAQQAQYGVWLKRELIGLPCRHQLVFMTLLRLLSFLTVLNKGAKKIIRK